MVFCIIVVSFVGSALDEKQRSTKKACITFKKIGPKDVEPIMKNNSKGVTGARDADPWLT
jgi:hypothetical protein